MRVSSDPHAWLRPIYRQLAADRSFALISVETQFSMLVEAAAAQSEHRAALLREFNHTTRVALLGHLAKLEQQRPGPRQIAMWTAQKGARTLSCVALYLAHGVDVRLLEGEELRRTQLVKDGPAAEALADEWRVAALKLGWSA